MTAFSIQYLILALLYNGFISVSSFRSARQSFRRTSGVCLSSTSVPLPPWSFQARRIFYQFQAIPVNNAREYCPPCNNSQNNLLQLLSVGGYTLGGIFCLEYDDSPIGPYREVAILSSLVAQLPSPPSVWVPSIGAWASHIFVDSRDAAEYGKEFWGLPATVMPIQFSDDDKQACYFSDKEIVVSGWQQWNACESREIEWFDLALPSFSGLLPKDDNTTTSLLQYPLRIISPSSVEFSTQKRVILDSSCSSLALQEVQSLLEKSRPLVAVNVHSVGLVAGVPSIIN